MEKNQSMGKTKKVKKWKEPKLVKNDWDQIVQLDHTKYDP